MRVEQSPSGLELGSQLAANLFGERDKATSQRFGNLEPSFFAVDVAEHPDVFALVDDVVPAIDEGAVHRCRL